MDTSSDQMLSERHNKAEVAAMGTIAVPLIESTLGADVFAVYS